MASKGQELNEKTVILHQNSKPCMSKKRMIKNIAVVCIGVIFLFTAYDGPVMLQSTMNKEGGIGVLCQAIDYICFCISALLFPKYIIKRFGSKATLVVSMLTYIPYIAANYYPHWSVMLPTSILIGFGAATLWGSQATYLNDLSVMFAELSLYNKGIKVSNEPRRLYSGTNNKHNVLFHQDSVYKQSDSTSTNNTENSEKIHLSKQGANSKDKSAENGRKNSSDHIQPIDSLSSKVVEQSQNIDCVIEPFNYNSEMKHCHSAETVLVEDEKSTTDLSILYSTNDKSAKVVQTSSNNYIAVRKKQIESVTARVFGIHGMSYLICHLSGNVISFLITKNGIDPESYLSNSTCVCGADFCNIESHCFTHNVEEISAETRITLTSVCVSLAIASVIIVALFLDPLETDSKKESFSLDLLMATFKLAKRTDLVLLIPSSFYIGQAQGFFAGEFNKAYIGCAWGTYHVSLVSICYGFFCAIFATSSGWLVKLLNRIPVFTFAALLNIASNILLLLWSPNPEHPEMFFIFAGMWGAFVGIIWSQLRAFYGVLFKAEEEAAFSAFHVWYSLGFALSFGYSIYFCTSVKIYVLLIISNLGYIGYLFVEKRFANSKTLQDVS